VGSPATSEVAKPARSSLAKRRRFCRCFGGFNGSAKAFYQHFFDEPTAADPAAIVRELDLKNCANISDFDLKLIRLAALKQLICII